MYFLNGPAQGKTPLHSATKYRKLEAAKVLIERGADVNSRCFDLKTPFHVSVEKEDLEMIQLFLDNKADVNAKTLEGSTPLHVAALFGKVKALKLLLSYGAGKSFYNLNH
jgi:ankyrin repeat protein